MLRFVVPSACRKTASVAVSSAAVAHGANPHPSPISLTATAGSSLSGSSARLALCSSPLFAAARHYADGPKDFYKILGVDKGADLKAIKAAYRKRALATHPDQGGNKEEFAEVAEAYEVLSSPEKRRVYDQYGSEAATNPNMGAGGFGGGGGGGMGGRSAEDIFSEFFRGAGMGGFGDMFGGGMGGGGMGGGIPVVQPQEVRLRLTLEDVYRGVTKTVRVTRPQVCSQCDGHGTKSKTEKPKCTSCSGSGRVVQQHRVGPGMVQQTVSDCPRCHGTGSSAKAEDQCPKCFGKGYRNVAQDVAIDIPAGVPSNVTLVVRGEGGVIPKAQPGDLHVHVEVSPHRVFERRGDDLIVRKEVSLSEALLGMKMPLKLLDGRTVNVESSTDSVLKPDGVIKLPGEGMPSTTGGRGDIYIFTTLKMPAKLTSEQKDLVAKAFGAPAASKEAAPGNTVKARVMRETREQLEDQKRGVWSAQQGGGSSRRGAGGMGGMGGGAQQAECAAQ